MGNFDEAVAVYAVVLLWLALAAGSVVMLRRRGARRPAGADAPAGTAVRDTPRAA